MMKPKILILGCGGFIGSHLIDMLSKDYFIIGVDKDDYKLNNLDNFTFYKFDIYLNLGLVENLISNIDIVIFLATMCNPSLYITKTKETIISNFIQPISIIDLCQKYKKWLITFSTCEVYGQTISNFVDKSYVNKDYYIQKEDLTPCIFSSSKDSRWSYAIGKLLLDHYISSSDMKYTIVRPYNFFGSRMDYLPETENDKPRVLASFMNSLIYNKPIIIVDGGLAKRVFTYIDDATEAIKRIINVKPFGETINIGNPNNEISIYNLAIKIKEIYQEITGKVYDIPFEFVKGEEYYGKGYADCDKRIPDIFKARSLLGWEPKYNLDQTIYLTVLNFIEFYKQKGLLK